MLLGVWLAINYQLVNKYSLTFRLADLAIVTICHACQFIKNHSILIELITRFYSS